MDGIRYESVLYGTDSEVLPILISLHAKSEPNILDCTYNVGNIWKGTNYKPLRMDIDSSFDLDVVGDFRNMPFSDASFDIILFDPPHLPSSAASPNSSKIWEKRYGINNEGRKGDNVSELFLPFLKEAKRVLADDGIVLCKISDLIHNHCYQWQHVDFINACRDVGLIPCDMMIKCDPKAGNLKSSKWKKVYHLRKAHCYWIVVRKGTCERPK